MNEPAAFTGLVDLAAEAHGGRVLGSSDDFFASCERLIASGRGEFDPDRYTERGKWMDGWESRRKRVPGHDWCIVQLAVPGILEGVDIEIYESLVLPRVLEQVVGCGDEIAQLCLDRELLPILDTAYQVRTAACSKRCCSRWAAPSH